MADYTLPDLIRIHYTTIDRFSESKRFKTLKGARAYVKRRLGACYDLGGNYAVSGDGVGKLWANIPLAWLVGVAPETLIDVATT